MTKKRPLNRNRPRPKRQRTPTILYSDDNPSTFTTKIKGGKPVELPPPVVVQLPQKRKYVRRKPLNTPPKSPRDAPSKPKQEAPSKSLEPSTEPQSPESHKRKRKRPPPTKTAVDFTSPAAAAGSVEPKLPSMTSDCIGTLMPHTVTIAPILPPPVDKIDAMEQKFPSVFGNGLGNFPSLEKPNWKPLYNPDVYFEQDYTSENGQVRRLDPELHPVTRSVTCMASRRPDNAYFAVGDSAGFVSIYSLGPRIRPIARLETLACQQRAYQQQERIRDQIRRKKKLRTLVVDSSQTTVHALGFVGSRVVLATACELECMDIPSQTSLWVCPLSGDRLVTNLDMHPLTFDVLVSCKLQNKSRDHPTSPLMLMQHSHNNVEICDANTPVLVKSPCCTAIWDCSKSADNRLLFVTPDDQELELVLVQGGSIDNWKVACKTRIPVKSSNLTNLTQSAEGLYTLVACSRGIRLYETESLQLLHVYGDQLALHGKSIVWQDCFLLGDASSAMAADAKVRGHCVQYKDALNMSNVGNGEKSSDLGRYVVGVPHPKGPKELCETLHVWRVEQATTVPALTIPLPPKSEGVQNIVADSLHDDRLVLATTSGTCHELLPSFSSNFAGIMYPPGYHLIQESVEYIEDEDELDHVDDRGDEGKSIQKLELDSDSEVDDELSAVDADLKEAMRRSLIEQKIGDGVGDAVEEDEDVIVVDDEPDLQPRSIILPCRPEVFLQQAVNLEDQSSIAIQAEDENITFEQVLGTIPNADVCQQRLQDQKSQQEFSFQVTVKTVIIPNAIKTTTRGKRGRYSNLEAMLKASIDPNLQQLMKSQQQQWADGSGSAMRHPISLAENGSIHPREQVTGERTSIAHLAAMEASFPAVSDAGSSVVDDSHTENDVRASPALVPEPLTDTVMSVSTPGAPIEPPPLRVVSETSQSSDSAANTELRNKIIAAEGQITPDGNGAASEREEAGFESAVFSERPISDGAGRERRGSDNKADSARTGEDTAKGEQVISSTAPAVNQEISPNNPENSVISGPEVPSSGLTNGISKQSPLKPPFALATCSDQPSGSRNVSDEAAVALGLLGLSPCNAIVVPDGTSEVMPAQISSTTGANVGNIFSYAGSQSDGFSETASRASSSAFFQSPYGTGDSAYSDRGSLNVEASSVGNSVVDAARQFASSVLKPVVDMNCYACRGRLVLHTCGKRSLPIDFDEVVRAERDRKEKEEEEKKRARAEKRRLADARRREARKMKQRELEERRRSEEEALKIEKARLVRIDDRAYNQSSFQLDQARSRREEILAAAHALEESEGRTQPEYAEQSYRELSQNNPHIEGAHHISHSANYSEVPAYEQGPADRPWSEAGHSTFSCDARVERGSSYLTYADSQGVGQGEYPQATFVKPSAPKRESSAGTLSSAEALAALAGLAGGATEAAESSYVGVNADQNLLSSYNFSVSHGFNDSNSAKPGQATTYPERKRAIPSYEDIRGQGTGDAVYNNSFCSYESAKPSLGNIVVNNGEGGTYNLESRWPEANGISGSAAKASRAEHYVTYATADPTITKPSESHASTMEQGLWGT